MDFTDFTQIYSNFTTLRKFYTGFTFWDGLILHSDDKLITISEKKYTECKVYEKKWGGTISERDDENYFRTGRRSGNLYLRHEYDIFVRRVDEERISLKNLWIFHMDEFLDWEGRPLPVADTYESLEGTMNACFYGRIDEELNVPKERRIWPRIDNIDYADNLCEELGGVDTVWAGVGATGLVAFNEAPRNYCYRLTVDEYAQGKTRIVELNDDSYAYCYHYQWRLSELYGE